MSTSWFDRARRLSKRLFSPKRNAPQPRREVRTRLTLEALEDRTLLSASGIDPIVQSPSMAIAQYGLQESRNYISSYVSTLVTVERMVENLEQQAFFAASRMESTVQQTVEQFLQQTLFPTTTEASPSAQSSPTPPGQPGGQTSNQTALQPLPTQELTTTSVGVAVPVGEASPAGGPGQPVGFSPSQISQAYGFNQITFNNGTVKGDGSGQTIAIVDAYNQPNIASDLQTFDSMYGIAAPPSFTVVNQTGGSTLPGLPLLTQTGH
jgi:hypothetical protein